jgi:hypothetical protein
MQYQSIISSNLILCPKPNAHPETVADDAAPAGAALTLIDTLLCGTC